MGKIERKIRDRERRIQEIQNAARDVFKRKGFQSATIGEIAEIAEVSSGTVFFYFNTKEQLYVSLILSTMEEFKKLLDSIYTDVSNGKYKSCETLMSAVIGMYVKLHKKDAEGCYIIQNYQLNSLYGLLSPELQLQLKKIGKHNFNTIRAIFDKALELKLIQNVSTYMLADVIWSAFLGMAQVEKVKQLTSKKNRLEPTLKFLGTLLCSGMANSMDSKKSK